MKILLIDAYNMFHIARSGFTQGDNFVVYNFFRALKSHIETFEPTRVVFALDGSKHKRTDMTEAYKANRVIDTNDTKTMAKHEDFVRQRKLIVEQLCTNFPVSVVRHPDFEADDTIYNLIDNASKITEWIVLSTDTDYIQLLQKFDNIKLYNPVKKAYVEAPAYDYVIWKSLRGDGSDNISGIPGFGDVKATKYANDLTLLQTLEKDQAETYSLNKKLITFFKWTPEEELQMESSQPSINLKNAKEFFASLGFNSFLKEKYWTAFEAVFNKLVAGKNESNPT